eukprot:scaffold76740_cov28-Tisochrysis_lutea.AAC.5
MALVLEARADHLLERLELKLSAEVGHGGPHLARALKHRRLSARGVQESIQVESCRGKVCLGMR